jgi:hypothetical protein
MRPPCCLCPPPTKNLFVCVFVAALTRLSSRCLAVAASSGSTIPASYQTASKVVGRGVFYAVRVVSYTQYAVKRFVVPKLLVCARARIYVYTFLQGQFLRNLKLYESSQKPNNDPYYGPLQSPLQHTPNQRK